MRQSNQRAFPTSSPHVADVHVIRGSGCAEDCAPDLLIEVPHGATATADFNAFADALEGPLPNGLVDFFHVNTDVGAFELGVATAERLISTTPTRCVLIVRSRIPRTFIDCNRRIDASPDEFREGGVTPGTMPWVTSAADRALLRSRYDAYLATVQAAVDVLKPGAATLLLHTYGPRTVGVSVDKDIVTKLHLAYRPGVVEKWPMRPELDVIARDTEGREHAPPEVVEAIRANFADLEWTVGDSATYPMHPAALAWDHVIARPGLVLCLEVRRDLLADPFAPFDEMQISDQKLERIAAPLADAIGNWGQS